MNISGCDNSDKKKAQNRQAQKLYRQRMKEKIRNLQAKVDAFEQHVSSYEQTADGSSCNPSDSSKFLQTTFASAVTPAPCDGLRSNPIHRSEHKWATMEEILLQERAGCDLAILNEPFSEDGVAEEPSTSPLLDTLGNTITAGDIEPCVDGTLDGLSELSMLDGTVFRCQRTENITTSSSAPVSPSTSSTNSRSVESRIALVIEKARAEGFSDLDSVLTEYYTATLSTLSVEQRLSRNRRLPSTIAGLSRSAQEWSEWERRGLQEELVRSSDAVLLNELQSFRRTSRHLISDEIWTTRLQRGGESLEIFHEQMQNLAALVTSLTSEDDTRSMDKAARVMIAMCMNSNT